MHRRRPLRFRADPHLHLRQLVHRRQLQCIRCVCHRREDLAEIGGGVGRTSVRDPDVPSHGFPIRGPATGVGGCCHHADTVHLLQIWRIYTHKVCLGHTSTEVSQRGEALEYYPIHNRKSVLHAYYNTIP